MNPQVDILLATFQGETFIEEQLTSLLHQTYPFFHLWIRDDHSSDRTFPILQKWAQKYPEKMTLLPSKERLGVKGNFSELMHHCRSPYILFADQDDKWLPHKIEISVKRLKAMEKKYTSDVPLLVHTDLKVDQKLKEIAPSFWRYTGLKPSKTSLRHLLTQNVITGCTLLINRSLLNLAYPIPKEAVMHDWWIGLLAACFGHIECIEEPTILYRQHDSNDTGAKPYHFYSFLNQSKREKQKKEHSQKQTYQQAECLIEHYNELLAVDKLTLLKAYRKLETLSAFKRKIQIIKHQFFKQGLLRNAKMILFE